MPHERIDSKQSRADFRRFFKCGRPLVLIALLIDGDVFETMQPFMGGGDMIETVTDRGSTYQNNEHKFEAGTPRIAEAVGWCAAFDWLSKINLPEEHNRLIKIARWVSGQLRSMGISVYGRHDEKDSAVVSFLHTKIHSEDLAHLFDSRGIAVRTGHHCAQPLLHSWGFTGTVQGIILLVQYDG